ncbi:MAG: hypothetical protein ACLF0P_15460 [Thermoanaerobaculia bacterium]
MNSLSRAELEALMAHREGLCVSIYAPMVKAGPETQQNPIRFKNLVRQAQEGLEERGWSAKDAERFLQPAAELLYDSPFWQHQQDGLAVFLAEGFFRHHLVPYTVHELTVIEDRFHLKPLLPLLSGDGRFYVLALSQKHVRLLEATRHSVRELDLGDLPTSLDDALGYEVEESHLQYHTGTRTAQGNRSPVYHGQGGGEDDAKPEILKFFNMLDDGVGSLVADRQAPLVLAGVEFLFPIYREAADYPHLVEGGVPGNPDELGDDELRDRAWPLVEPLFRRSQEDAEARFRELLGTGQASAQLEEVVTAAYDGRVESLFVALGTRRWGRFDPENRQVILAEGNGPGTEDLVDAAAIQSVLKGGAVFAVEPDQVPEGGPVAAVFRY